MSEIKWVSKRIVEVQEGTGLQENDSFSCNKSIGNGQLHICSQNGRSRIELRTMPDTGEKYKYMARGVADAALNNADELLGRAVASAGKSILCAMTHTPSSVSRRVKVTTSMSGWDKDMAKLKESNYGMNEITKEIWSKGLSKIDRISQRGDFILLYDNYIRCYKLIFVSVKEAKNCFSVLRQEGGFQ